MANALYQSLFHRDEELDWELKERDEALRAKQREHEERLAAEAELARLRAEVEQLRRQQPGRS